MGPRRLNAKPGAMQNASSSARPSIFRNCLINSLMLPSLWGLSNVDFVRWLPKAIAAVEKARAIVEDRREPDEQTEPSEL